eukprot:59463-Hanusia_phi.AAC.1
MLQLNYPHPYHPYPPHPNIPLLPHTNAWFYHPCSLPPTPPLQLLRHLNSLQPSHDALPGPRRGRPAGLAADRTGAAEREASGRPDRQRQRKWTES